MNTINKVILAVLMISAGMVQAAEKHRPEQGWKNDTVYQFDILHRLQGTAMGRVFGEDYFISGVWPNGNALYVSLLTNHMRREEHLAQKKYVDTFMKRCLKLGQGGPVHEYCAEAPTISNATHDMYVNIDLYDPFYLKLQRDAESEYLERVSYSRRSNEPSDDQSYLTSPIFRFEDDSAQHMASVLEEAQNDAEAQWVMESQEQLEARKSFLKRKRAENIKTVLGWRKGIEWYKAIVEKKHNDFDARIEGFKPKYLLAQNIGLPHAHTASKQVAAAQDSHAATRKGHRAIDPNRAKRNTWSKWLANGTMAGAAGLVMFNKFRQK